MPLEKQLAVREDLVHMTPPSLVMLPSTALGDLAKGAACAILGWLLPQYAK